ncbi:MAG: PhnD/SsuA/transferrin family substrate-binding protein [Hyphomicrobiaceae bacterium]|nr:MAG: PhnD/SsuA/transferrin family substrate-binding protein [Hyphomicrobiaceae bacterium]
MTLLQRALFIAFAITAAWPSLAAEKVTVGVLRFVSSAPLFIAQERGYFAAEGLEVEFKFFQAAQPIAVAIASGDADFGVTAFTSGFFNLAGQGALKVIGAQSREEPGFDFSAVLASKTAYDHGLKSIEQLKGRTLAITTPGSSFHYMIGALGLKRGWPKDAVQLRSLQTPANMIGALKSSQVDAAILPAFLAKPLIAANEAHLLGWVHAEIPYQLGGLFTSSKNAKDRRPVVEKFVRAYQRAAADYSGALNARDAQGKRVFGPEADPIIAIIIKYVPNQTPEKVKDAANFIDPQGRLNVGDIHAQVAYFKSQGIVDQGVDAKTFIDVSFIKGHFNIPK